MTRFHINYPHETPTLNVIDDCWKQCLMKKSYYFTSENNKNILDFKEKSEIVNIREVILSNK